MIRPSFFIASAALAFFAAAAVAQGSAALDLVAELKTLGPDDPPPFAARLFAGASLACWIGVIAAGRVITAFRPPSWFWCAWCG